MLNDKIESKTTLNITNSSKVSCLGATATCTKCIGTPLKETEGCLLITEFKCSCRWVVIGKFPTIHFFSVSLFQDYWWLFLSQSQLMAAKNNCLIVRFWTSEFTSNNWIILRSIFEATFNFEKSTRLCYSTVSYHDSTLYLEVNPKICKYKW